MDLAFDKIVRQRIYDSTYWKQFCYELNAATLCDEAVKLTCVGGLCSNQRPTPFLCLCLKLALIHPEREIIEEYLKQPHFKYLTAIAAVYVRLFYSPKDVFLLLEPLLKDYRKLRFQTATSMELRHVDELADMLLTQSRLCDISFPLLLARHLLEDRGLPVYEDSESEESN